MSVTQVINVILVNYFHFFLYHSYQRGQKQNTLGWPHSLAAKCLTKMGAGNLEDKSIVNTRQNFGIAQGAEPSTYRRLRHVLALCLQRASRRITCEILNPHLCWKCTSRLITQSQDKEEIFMSTVSMSHKK